MSRIINLYGGPGTGKSTSAAYLFSKLKMAGNNAELVREYVKDWAWEGRTIGVYDQIYFLGKQIRKESMLFGKVDTIVTDSPVMLAGFYAERYSPDPIKDAVDEALKGYYEQCRLDGHVHHHVFLQRSKPYNSKGRFQTADEAVLFDKYMFDFLREREINPWMLGTEARHLDLFVEEFVKDTVV
jgi:hypothetical protein